LTAQRPSKPPVLALTQGDPAGIGPEILLKLIARAPVSPEAGEGGDYLPLLVAERSALEAVRPVVPAAAFERLVFLPRGEAEAMDPAALRTAAGGGVPVVDPVGETRRVEPGRSGAADARGALAALDAGVDLVRHGPAAALVTAPVSKESISRHALPGFTGHTDYLAERAGLLRYGRDYLMTFLAPRLRVALLSTHLPLREAIDRVTQPAVLEALECLVRHASGGARPRIAVAGLNPHAGEGGLLGSEDAETIAPAIAAARGRGIDAHGPESADSLFARAARGEFDWVLALYHDQGLIAVKTASFGDATNWTLGLPYLRTSVDHGTAFAIAGRGEADAGPLARTVATTLELLGHPPPGR
jgi:4-hydroxythreonine-4-phosphate dehydrogenase